MHINPTRGIYQANKPFYGFGDEKLRVSVDYSTLIFFSVQHPIGFLDTDLMLDPLYRNQRNIRVSDSNQVPIGSQRTPIPVFVLRNFMNGCKDWIFQFTELSLFFPESTLTFNLRNSILQY